MKRIITCLPFCTGLPRFGAVLAHRLPCARNDGCALMSLRGRPKEGRGNPEHAFSLVELLVALIIISLITASFIPILVKKLRREGISISSKSGLSANCYHIDNEGYCKLCIKNECISCQRSCETGYYPDPLTCKCKECQLECKACTDAYSCVSCKAGYGSKEKGCAKCSLGTYSSVGECENCPNGFINEQRTTCTSCSGEYGQYCSTCSSKECLSCITSEYELAEDKKSCKIKDPCFKYNAVFIEEASRGIKICAAKFNAGDSGGLDIPSGVDIKSTISSGAGIFGAHSQAICWKGISALGCDDTNGGYSGCQRTVCTWYAADKICKYHGWRLPKNDEIPFFKNYSAAKGINGLQLCDAYINNSSAFCSNGQGKCPGSSTGYCHPSHIWSNQTFSSLSRNDFYLANGSIEGPELNNASYAFSVRCVLDL